jgi:hypothetical protein
MTDTPHTQKVQVVNLGKPWHHAYKELYSHACEQEKEIAKLREALKEISTEAHCISKAGPLNTPTLQDAWGKFMHIDAMATKALSK